MYAGLTRFILCYLPSLLSSLRRPCLSLLFVFCSLFLSFPPSHICLYSPSLACLLTILGCRSTILVTLDISYVFCNGSCSLSLFPLQAPSARALHASVLASSSPQLSTLLDLSVPVCPNNHEHMFPRAVPEAKGLLDLAACVCPQ